MGGARGGGSRRIYPPFYPLPQTFGCLRQAQAPSTSRGAHVEAPEFDIGFILQGGTQTELSDDVVAAYRAPFPDETYKEGARIFPSLVPISPDDPAAPANRKAWKVFSNFEKPFLTAFSDHDPVTAGGDEVLQKLIPGARGQPHTTIKGGGHFLQEDCGEEFARIVVDFIART